MDYRIVIDKNSISIRSLPYPEMAMWYLTLQYICNGLVEFLKIISLKSFCFLFSSETECANAPLSLMFQITSSQCTKQQCGTYGICRIMTSQQNVFSTCTCIAG